MGRAAIMPRLLGDEQIRAHAHALLSKQRRVTLEIKERRFFASSVLPLSEFSWEFWEGLGTR